MKIKNRRNWDEDDFNIEKEFEDVSSALDSIQQPVPGVPANLDRRVRDLAGYQAGNDLSENWIFTRTPQLAVAAVLLFGIGVYYVLGQSNEANIVSESKAVSSDLQVPATLYDDESSVESVQVSSGYSWVRLRFNVDDRGEVREITVIESCLKTAPQGHCIDDDVHDSYAIAQVKLNTFREPGEMEEIIFIPPEYISQ